MGIPLIDLSGALQPGAPRSPAVMAVAAQLRQARMGAGFFYVRHHGVPQDVIARQFELAQQFFDLPLASKEAISLHHSPAMRGYESLGGQTLDANARPDLKESFYCGLGPVRPIFSSAKASPATPIEARDDAKGGALARNATTSGVAGEAFPSGCDAQGPSAALPSLTGAAPQLRLAPYAWPLGIATHLEKIG